MNKVTGCVVIRVDMSNPNGNIDDGGPRVLPDGCGWISPVCCKRQIRELLADHESPVFRELTSMTEIPDERLHIFETEEKGFEGKKGMDAVKAALALSDEEKLDKYFDLRVFGATCLPEREDKTQKGGTGRFLRTGCVQFGSPISLSPIEVVTAGISKKAPLRDTTEGQDNGGLWQSDFAPDGVKVVRHGLYFGLFHISPTEAAKTNASKEDFELLLQLIPHMFSKKAAQRAGVEVVAAFSAEHTSVLGSFPEHLFEEACRPKLRDSNTIPTSVNDYVIPTWQDVKDAMKEHKTGHIKNLLK